MVLDEDDELIDELFLLADVVRVVGECWRMTRIQRRLHLPRAQMVRYGTSLSESLKIWIAWVYLVQLFLTLVFL